MTRYLIDTNVISELTRPRPSNNVVEWLKKTPLEDQWICTITLAEIHKGIHLARDDKKRAYLKEWIETLRNSFKERIFGLDTDTAMTLGRLLAKKPTAIPPFDSIIAAVALTHSLTLVTRNVKDFDITGLKVLNPWNA
jgi:predicted nucleic acid-binding protein